MTITLLLSLIGIERYFSVWCSLSLAALGMLHGATRAAAFVLMGDRIAHE